MKILITGGGFLASHLSDVLRPFHDVTVFGNDPSHLGGTEFEEGDVRDLRSLERAASGCDLIFHLAGLLGTDYLCDKALDAVDVNIRGALNVFELSRRFRTRVVNIGLVPDWDNSYMITKKTAARFGRMYCKEFGANIVTVEITHAYGPRQKTAPYRKAIPTFISSALRGEPIEIYGDGNQVMDCIYVTDVATGLRLIAESDRQMPATIQLGSGQVTTVAQLAVTINSLLGSTSPIINSPMRAGEQNDDYATRVDSRWWGQRFNWAPSTTLREGLSKTIEWYRSIKSPQD